MRTISCLLFFIAACQFKATAQFHPLSTFIPQGFTILDTTSGDLNKDGNKDMVLILKNAHEDDNTDTSRPLLLLAGNKDGQYKLIARNDHVVLCKGCGGIFGDPYEGLSIKNGFFSIEHYGGSNWRWTRIITFRFDKIKNQFILHRDAGDSFHTSNPNKTTEQLYNKQDFGRLLFTRYTSEKGL